MKTEARVLVVDDEEKNLRLMEAVLIAAGYRVDLCGNGTEALEKAAKSAPDVILLDIMMPVLDGFETCRRLKADPLTAYIPVLLVTSLGERNDRIKGIAAGANDFIMKPIDKEDVVLRVRNAAYAKSLYDQVQRHYEKLKQLEALRDNLTHMIVHDLRSPLSGATVYLQLLQMGLKKANDSKFLDYVVKAMHSLDILMEMINSLLDINRLEEGKMPIDIQQCDLRKVSNEALEALGALRNKCKIGIDSPADLPLVSCDPDLIRRVIGNLLGNAVKFTPQDGIITVSISLHEKNVRVSVADNGPGIPSVYHGKIFEKFGQVEMRKEGKVHSSGLGLTFGKLAVEAHGGSIGVESEAGKGSTIWFTLPVDR